MVAARIFLIDPKTCNEKCKANICLYLPKILCCPSSRQLLVCRQESGRHPLLGLGTLCRGRRDPWLRWAGVGWTWGGRGWGVVGHGTSLWAAALPCAILCHPLCRSHASGGGTGLGAGWAVSVPAGGAVGGVLPARPRFGRAVSPSACRNERGEQRARAVLTFLHLCRFQLKPPLIQSVALLVGGEEKQL